MLMYTPATAGSIITACVVLHNIMIAVKYPLQLEADIIAEMDDHDEDDLPNLHYNTSANSKCWQRCSKSSCS